MEILDKLIQLFSNQSIHEIESGYSGYLKQTFGVDQYETLLKDENFQYDYFRVKKVKKHIEDFISNTEEMEIAHQVKQSLRWFRSIKKNIPEQILISARCQV